MNREFEFRQLLRAYRSGIISEAVFEEEMAKLEGDAATNGDGGDFQAFGRGYKSERDALVSFLDKVCAGEANGGEAFAAWAAVCKTDCLRTGLRMIAEREACHARIFEQRLLEIGGEKRATPTEEGLRFRAYLGDPNVSDIEKLINFTKNVGSAEEAVRPVNDFAELIKDDLETREALRLFAQDEFSSVTWVWEMCTAFSAPKEAEIVEGEEPEETAM